MLLKVRLVASDGASGNDPDIATLILVKADGAEADPCQVTLRRER